MSQAVYPNKSKRIETQRRGCRSPPPQSVPRLRPGELPMPRAPQSTPPRSIRDRVDRGRPQFAINPPASSSLAPSEPVELKRQVVGEEANSEEHQSSAWHPMPWIASPQALDDACPARSSDFVRWGRDPGVQVTCPIRLADIRSPCATTGRIGRGGSCNASSINDLNQEQEHRRVRGGPRALRHPIPCACVGLGGFGDRGVTTGAGRPATLRLAATCASIGVVWR